MALPTSTNSFCCPRHVAADRYISHPHSARVNLKNADCCNDAMRDHSKGQVGGNHGKLSGLRPDVVRSGNAASTASETILTTPLTAGSHCRVSEPSSARSLYRRL